MGRWPTTPEAATPERVGRWAATPERVGRWATAPERALRLAPARGTRPPARGTRPRLAGLGWRGGSVGLLGRPWRHVHRHRGPAAGWLARGPQAAVGQPFLQGRRGGGHP